MGVLEDMARRVGRVLVPKARDEVHHDEAEQVSAAVPSLEGRVLALMRDGFNGQNAASIYWKLFGSFDRLVAIQLDEALAQMVRIDLIFEGENHRFYLVDRAPKKPAADSGQKNQGKTPFESGSPERHTARRGWERSGK